jgi:hypothetical protein
MDLNILSDLYATNSKDEFNNYLTKHNYTLETILESSYNPLLFELRWSRGDFEWLVTTHSFDPDIGDLQGRTLLFPPYCDVCYDSEKILIIRCGVDVNAKDVYGNSAIHYCDTFGFFSLLLENGASFKEAQETISQKTCSLYLSAIQRYQQSSENCKNTLVVFLKINKQHHFIHKDLVKVIAKMVWKTRRQKRVWCVSE